MQDVMIPVRDGVRLAADIYMPSADDGGPVDGPCPALLIRTSWDKSNEEWDEVRDYYPRQVYALVIQDLRSRFKSEGDGRYYHTANPWEGEDGYDKDHFNPFVPFFDCPMAANPCPCRISNC